MQHAYAIWVAYLVGAQAPSELTPLTGAGRRQRVRPVVIATQPQPLSTQRLNMAHHLLCESAVSVAKRYGLSLLVDMLCLLLHLVITAYFFFKHLLMLPPINQTVSNYYILIQAIWLFVHLGRMLMIVLPCSRASAEVRKPSNTPRTRGFQCSPPLKTCTPHPPWLSRYDNQGRSSLSGKS